VKAYHLLDESIEIVAKVLSPKEAIGNPEREDFVLFKGRERLIQATFRGYYGQAFTDMYGGFRGRLSEILEMPLHNNYRRALLVASINAVLRYLGKIRGTVHCRNDEPERCSQQLIKVLQERFPDVHRIALVGFQPAFTERLTVYFDLCILDRDVRNIGQEKYGVRILDYESHGLEVLRWSDVAVVTGSTIVNGTIDQILAYKSSDRVIFYGVTISGVAKLMQFNRFCPFSR